MSKRFPSKSQDGKERYDQTPLIGRLAQTLTELAREKDFTAAGMVQAVEPVLDKLADPPGRWMDAFYL